MMHTGILDIVRYDPMHHLYESYEEAQKVEADEESDTYS